MKGKGWVMESGRSFILFPECIRKVVLNPIASHLKARQQKGPGLIPVESRLRTNSHLPVILQDGSQEVPQHHPLVVAAVHQDAVGLAPRQKLGHPFFWAAFAVPVM